MEKSKTTFLIIFSFLCHAVLYSAPADTTSIIDNIYNYDFIKATAQLSKLNEKNPVIGETLNLEIKWWMAMERQNQDRFSEFLNTLNKFEKSANNGLAEIISLTYRMRYYACINKNYMIPFLFIKIKKQIGKVESAGLEDSGKDVFELYILYKSFLNLMQNSFFITKFLSDPQTIQKQTGDIEQVIRNGSAANRTIGRYFLMKYYLNVEKDKPKASDYLTELHKQYPKNKIFSQLLTN
jgi:hypothetical protein